MLGMRLIEGFARNAKGHRRVLRSAFASWKAHVESVKKNTAGLGCSS
jgi:hypothetical protein